MIFRVPAVLDVFYNSIYLLIFNSIWELIDSRSVHHSSGGSTPDILVLLLLDAHLEVIARKNDGKYLHWNGYLSPEGFDELYVAWND